MVAEANETCWRILIYVKIKYIHFFRFGFVGILYYINSFYCTDVEHLNLHNSFVVWKFEQIIPRVWIILEGLILWTAGYAFIDVI
jgi:hypothetical protein